MMPAGFISWIAVGVLATCAGLLGAEPAPAAGPVAVAAVPRVESVVMSPVQPQATDRATIWYDDFNGPPKAYTESTGDIDRTVGFGGTGGAMLCLYEKDQQGIGNRKVFFGDSPTGKVVRPGEKFNEIYWRIYVKHQEGWTSGSPDRGGPDKMSRATSIVSPSWNQAMISHVWSVGDTLTLDPASGVRDGQVVTTKYNDFDHLHWLGNKPTATFPIHSTAEAGWWVCVECRAKLNTPGKKDGLNQLWIDGRLEAERKNLDWRGTYDAHGINAVFLEAYWNKGSPVTQKRWYDNFIIATKPIGPVVCPRNPTIIKTPYRGPPDAAGDRLADWELGIAADAAGKSVVWRSKSLGAAERGAVTAQTGTFEGELAGQDRLAGDHTYVCRVRQRGTTAAWSDWSPWHQTFRTEP